MTETNQQQELQTTIIRVKTPKDPENFVIKNSTATLKKGELFFNPKTNYLYAGTYTGVPLKNLEPINRVYDNVIRLYKASSMSVNDYIYTINLTADNVLSGLNGYYTEYDFELYVNVPIGCGWQRNPDTEAGTKICLNFGTDENKNLSDELPLYILGRNKEDLEAPSGSFQENSMIRLYVRYNSELKSFDGVYIIPTISLWA